MVSRLVKLYEMVVAIVLKTISVCKVSFDIQAMQNNHLSDLLLKLLSMLSTIHRDLTN